MSSDFHNKLQSIGVLEFVHRVTHSLREYQQRTTWFLGAGCSVSSGISGTRELVGRWLRELFDMLPPASRPPFGQWLDEAFPSYTEDHHSRSYASVFRRRHPAPADRQREIEHICELAEPTYGYATLAQLLSLEREGKLCNTILTTNFDDLIADALYLYGDRHARPQIITHDSLAQYVRINSPRPTLVKLHGDAHLDPKNLDGETERLPDDMCEQLYPLIRDSALVFIGYGGNDQSILRFLRDCPKTILAHQIYWVGREAPSAEFAVWLLERNAIRVDHQDFDLLMHHFRGALSIRHPDAKRIERAMDTYYHKYAVLQGLIAETPEEAERIALEEASRTTAQSLPRTWALVNEALAASDENPELSRELFEEAIRVGENAEFHSLYAGFLSKQRDYSGADKHYRKAIDLSPDAMRLSTYALFLSYDKKDAVAAEACHLKAIEADGENSLAHYNYAIFLFHVLKDRERAAQRFKDALSVENVDPLVYIGYAQFLFVAGNSIEAFSYIALALQSKMLEVRMRIRAYFLLYAHDKNGQSKALANIKRLLKKSERSPNFDLEPTIDMACAGSHPCPELLLDLAHVIRGTKDIEDLGTHSDWVSAGRRKQRE